MTGLPGVSISRDGTLPVLKGRTVTFVPLLRVEVLRPLPREFTSEPCVSSSKSEFA